jgi:hypothetical protein
MEKIIVIVFRHRAGRAKASKIVIRILHSRYAKPELTLCETTIAPWRGMRREPSTN